MRDDFSVIFTEQSTKNWPRGFNNDAVILMMVTRALGRCIKASIAVHKG